MPPPLASPLPSRPHAHTHARAASATPRLNQLNAVLPLCAYRPIAEASCHAPSRIAPSRHLTSGRGCLCLWAEGTIGELNWHLTTRKPCSTGQRRKRGVSLTLSSPHFGQRKFNRAFRSVATPEPCPVLPAATPPSNPRPILAHARSSRRGHHTHQSTHQAHDEQRRVHIPSCRSGCGAMSPAGRIHDSPQVSSLKPRASNGDSTQYLPLASSCPVCPSACLIACCHPSQRASSPLSALLYGCCCCSCCSCTYTLFYAHLHTHTHTRTHTHHCTR